MKIKLDGLQFCADCLMAACNGDYSSFDDAQIEAAKKGLKRLGPYVVPAFDSETGEGITEFSRSPCDCCGSDLAGSRHEFAVLEPE